jgi:hypothetical protein
LLGAPSSAMSGRFRVDGRLDDPSLIEYEHP